MNLPGALIVFGIIMLMFGNLGGIGYFLYQWGGANVAIGLAAWAAFKFWMLWVGIGMISFLSGMLIKIKQG